MRRSILLCLISILISSTSFAKTHFTAKLTGDQENPAVTTPATGTGAFVLTDAGLAFTVTVEGLEFTNAHFHNEAAEQVTIHVEPDYDISSTLERIRELGAKPGIARNPKTECKAIEPYLEKIDIALAMTVQPGFGGQSFDESVLAKTAQIDHWRTDRSLDFRIQVDGGINRETARQCWNAGVDTFVAGTAFFKAENRKEFLREIEAMK